MSHLSCEDVRDVAAELALGSATGEERAHALVHIAECAECRALVEELSRTADSLLLLGPEREPPIGFETRAMARFAPHRRRRPSWRSLVAAALVAALSAGGTLAVMARVNTNDHKLAVRYEKLIQQLGGRTLRAAELRSLDGTPVGKVYAYDGKPSWLFLVLDDSEGTGNYQVEVDPVGDSIRLAGVQIHDGKASWATTAAVAIDDIQSVNIIDSTGVPIYGAQFKSTPSK